MDQEASKQQPRRVTQKGRLRQCEMCRWWEFDAWQRIEYIRDWIVGNLNWIKLATYSYTWLTIPCQYTIIMSIVTRVVLFSLIPRVLCVPHPISSHHDNILPTRTSHPEGLRRRDSGLDLSPTPAPTGGVSATPKILDPLNVWYLLGPNSINTTVWIRDATNFAILLPPSPGGVSHLSPWGIVTCIHFCSI